MAQVDWFSEVVEFAIEKEIEAQRFYLELAELMDNPMMREIFEGFAKEEAGHKTKLESLKEGKFEVKKEKKAESLNLDDYLVDTEPKSDMSYADALILAMKKEKASYKLYADLALLADSAEMEATFQWLANEEAKHKLRFEIEYDEVILRDA